MSVTQHGGHSGDVPLPPYYEKNAGDIRTMLSKIENGKPAPEEEDEQKQSYLVALIQEYADNGTAHGIPRIIGSNYLIAKFFWLCLVLAFAGVFAWQGQGLILDYISAPYNTKIDIITKTLVDFPAVTVCNMNRMKRSSLLNTRFEGIVDVDGGFDLEDGNYAWFFDFSSAFYDDFYSDWDWTSSGTVGPSSNGGGGGSSSGGGGGGPSSGGGGGPSSGGGGEGGGPSSGGGGGGGGPSGGGGGGPSSGGGGGGGGGPSGGGGGGPSSGGRGGGPSSGGGGGPSSGSGGSSGFGYSYYTPWHEANSWADDFGGWDFDAFDSFAFEYDDYYDWDVEGESDWDGFYRQSKSADFSDIADIANPTKEELREFGHQAEDFILQCTFDKRSCNYTDFFQFQNSAYGNCYTFNHGLENTTVRETSKSGAQYGLHLTLFIEQPEYVGIFSPESGVRVSVHDAGVKPNPEDIGITATTGMATSVGMRQLKITRLGGKYSTCTDGSDLDYGDSKYSYSSLACRKHCLQREMADTCGCVSDILDLDTPKCSYINSTQQRCKQLVNTLYDDDKLECDCPDACDEISYPTSASSALWPSEKYSQHLYTRVSEVNDKAARTLQDVETTRKNVVRLRLFFEELNYQLMEQQPVWSIEGISGAVGGLMGLYLGISAISFVEICLFLLKLVIYICSCGHVCIKTKVHP